MDIRPEAPADYAAIAALTIRAFGGQLGPSLIAAYQRQRSTFDATLSLVADDGGEIVGHVLFTPQRMQLLGESVSSVILSPLAVAPARQKRGIGAALIEAGHALARDKGFALSVLVGHPTYYPRFGYRTHAYGHASLGMWSEKAAPLVSRPLDEADLPALQALWQAQEAEVDFSMQPLPEMVDWISPNPAVRVAVYERDGEIVGYSRAHTMRPHAPLYFLARDADAARSMIWHLAGVGAMVSLPVHPNVPWAAELGGASVSAFDAAMACPLTPGAYDTYEQAVKSGARPAGSVIWGTAFDID